MGKRVENENQHKKKTTKFCVLSLDNRISENAGEVGFAVTYM